MKSDLDILPGLVARTKQLRLDYLRVRGKLPRGEHPEVGRELRQELATLENYIFILRGAQVD